MHTANLTIQLAAGATSEPPAFFLGNPPDHPQYKIHFVSSGSGYKTVVGKSTSEPIPEDPPGYFEYKLDLVASGSDRKSVVEKPEGRIVRTTFSTVQDIRQWELRQSYSELGAVLNELTSLEEDDEWKIDTSVYNAASYVATRLQQYFVRVPQVIVHGRTSVVFNWSDNFYNFYLTIAAQNIFAMLSSPERIIAERDYSGYEQLNPVQLLPPIPSALSDGRVISGQPGISDAPNFSG